MRYAVSYTSGLKSIVLDELCEIAGQTEARSTLIGKRYDYFVFDFEGDPGVLLRLRSAENVFSVASCFGGVAVARSKGLGRLKEVLDASDFSGPLRAFASARRLELPSEPGFRLTLQAQGHHAFSEGDVRGMVLERLRAEPSLGPLREGADVHVRLQIIRDAGLLGLQLPPRPLKSRPYKLVTRPGSLDPTVAYCLARMGELKPTDICLDPMCGAGTIAIEAGEGFGPRLICGDIDRAALRMARENVREAGLRAQPGCWDALRLPLADASVDTVVTNLPYGKDIPLGDPQAFVTGLLKELGRVVRRGGRIVLLSTHGSLILRALTRVSPFRKEQELPLALYGFDATLLVMRRRET